MNPPPAVNCEQNGCATVQVLSQRMSTVEKEQETMHDTVDKIFDKIDNLRTWIIGFLASVLIAGGGAVLAFVLTRGGK